MPAQLKEVRSRIGAVTSTQKITKAMKLVAASKLRKAQERIIKMRPYTTKLNDILGNITAATEGEVSIAYANERPVQNVLLVILTSDRGLCGGFNANMAKLLKLAVKEKYAQQAAAGNVHVMFVGKKGYDALKRENFKFISEHINLFGDLTFDNAIPVVDTVMNGFAKGNYDVVEVFYNRFKNQIVQEPMSEQFLPIEKLADESASAANDSKIKPDFIFQPNQAELIEELVPKILKTKFFGYLLNSNASEHGARMTAMDNATENAEDILRDLKILYNRARQAAITTELTEIVSGAAALQGN
ncbi:MAG: ATP synthase F1 subunit gamma [Chitinophagales bacterium]